MKQHKHLMDGIVYMIFALLTGHHGKRFRVMNAQAAIHEFLSLLKNGITGNEKKAVMLFIQLLVKKQIS